MGITDIQEHAADGSIVSTDNMSNLLSEQTEDMAADSFGDQLEFSNFDDNQEYLNFSLKNAVKKFASSKVATVLTGGANKLTTKDTRQNIGKDLKKANTDIAKSKVATVLTGGANKLLTKETRSELAKSKVATVLTGGANKLLTKDTRQNIGKDIKKIGQQLKTLNLAPMRGAYLGLAAINMFGIASQAQKIKDEADKGNPDGIKKWKNATDLWYKMGGNRTKFTDTVKKGSKKKALLKARKNADGTWENVAGADDAALIIAAASAIAAICKAFGGKPKEMSTQDQSLIDATAQETDAEFQEKMKLEQQANIPESERDDDIDVGGMSNTTWYMIGGGVLGLSILAYFLLRKKK